MAARQPEISGMQMTLDIFKKYRALATPVASFVMKAIAIKVEALSQKYVPVSRPEDLPEGGVPGSLKASVDLRQDGPTSWTISYGAGTGRFVWRRPYYAIFVHEDLEAEHRSPQQAKFLERAVYELEPEMIADAPGWFRREFGDVKYFAVDESGEHVGLPGD